MERVTTAAIRFCTYASPPKLQYRLAGDSAEPTETTSTSRLDRLLFGLGLALQAFEDVRDMDERIEYAGSPGVPVSELAAPFGSGTMLVSGLGLALWRFPRVATGAVVSVLAVVTLTMHGCWHEEDDASGERLAFFGTLAAFVRRSRSSARRIAEGPTRSAVEAWSLSSVRKGVSSSAL